MSKLVSTENVGCKEAVIELWKTNMYILGLVGIFSSVIGTIATIAVAIFLYKGRECPYN